MATWLEASPSNTSASKETTDFFGPQDGPACRNSRMKYSFQFYFSFQLAFAHKWVAQLCKKTQKIKNACQYSHTSSLKLPVMLL